MMDAKELERIIENHRHWLYEDIEGWETMKADFSDTNLRCADLRYADLRCANLRDADLRDADLRGTNLGGADLRDVDLRGANLRCADLGGANLSEADLGDANLRFAYMRFADLRCANLGCANLRGADLRGADLRDANLKYADLSKADLGEADLGCANLGCANLGGADLRGADLSGAKNVPYIPMICPEEGSFICYKKASDKIIKLYIPEDAKRSSATTRKCRCDRARVLGIYELDGSISNVTEVQSNYDSKFIYKINKEVVVDNFDSNRWNECSTGIHFFMQRHEAVRYMS